MNYHSTLKVPYYAGEAAADPGFVAGESSGDIGKVDVDQVNCLL